MELSGQRVTLFGLGHFGGGVAAARWLIERGAKLVVCDNAPGEKLGESLAQLRGVPIDFRLGPDQDIRSFTDTDLLVVSPAIPPANANIRAAQQATVPVTTEIELFVRHCPARRVIGVTGTKGKSTTAALLHQMLKSVGRSWLGGNIGVSLLDKLGQITPDDLVVLELSSFMLHWLGLGGWSPHLALTTIITADHLDWHGSRDAYVEAKRNIVRFQRPGDYAVLRDSDKVGRSFANDTPAQVIIYGKRGHLPEALAPQLLGRHNRVNERGAYAAAKIFGVYPDMAVEALVDFKGLPHRLELVHESQGVRWVNDSIATIPDAAVAALEAFPAGRVIQIVGGYDKKLPFESMCAALARRAKAVLTIGAVGPTLARLCREKPVDRRRATVVECETLDRAVAEARQLAGEGDIVLLSTGCSSYDQFENFEHRGLSFTALARQGQNAI